MAGAMALGLLPLATLTLLVMVIGNIAPSSSWIRVTLRASVVWGTYLVVSTELLSQAHWVTRAGLSVTWLAPLVGLAWTIHRLSRRGTHLRIPRFTFPRSRIGRVSLGIIGLVVLATAIIAWVAPPNTYDSLTYHMSRVAHWSQDHGLEPFATGILRQAYMSPGAEMMVLHFYVLMAGDRMANFVQWLAMIACVVGVAKIASDLGANHKGQWLAALFVATLPMGIAQASSTMTDYVVAWWVVCAAAEISEWAIADPRSEDFVVAGLAAGLALLTKPTAVAFLAPFAVLAFYMLVRTFSMRRAVLLASVAGLAVLGLNAGHWLRNLASFGAPLGSTDQVGMFTNEDLSWRVVVSNVLRNASLHAGTSWTWMNDQLYLGLAKIHWKLGLAMDDPRTSWHRFFAVLAPQPDESRIVNTWQALFALIAATMVLIWRRLRTTAVLTYTTLVVSSFALFSGLFKFDILGSRYHMPFFVLLAPIAGFVSGRLRSWASWLMVVVFCAGAYTPLLQLNQRPLLNTPRQASILHQDRQDMYLGSDRGLQEVYVAMTGRIKAAGCGSLGVMLNGDTPEYPLWVLMGAPRDDLFVDWIIRRSDATGKFRRPDFQACAVICQNCPPELVVLNGLPLKEDAGGFRLYLNETSLN